MEDEMMYDEKTNDGKRIIARVTVDGETYYITETKEIYEKQNNYYYVVTSEKIKEKVNKILYKTSDNFMDIY